MNQKKKKKNVNSKVGWWKKNLLSILYIIIPTIITLVLFQFKNGLVAQMQTTKAGEGNIENSTYMINHVAAPFVSCLLLSLSIILSILVMKLISYFTKKQLTLQNEKSWMYCIEVLLILTSAFIAIYTLATGFEYWKYGYDLSELKNAMETGDLAYLKLSPIPRLQSEGRYSSDSGLLYIVALRMAQFSRTSIKNLDIYTAIFSAMLIPLKIAAHRKERSSEKA